MYVERAAPAEMGFLFDILHPCIRRKKRGSRSPAGEPNGSETKHSDAENDMPEWMQKREHEVQ